LEHDMPTQALPAAVECPTDTELIASILAGDLGAMETLMRLYNRRLYRTARAILRDDAEAEDAVQEAYLQAFRKLATFRGESKLSTWLVRITANQALMRRRRNPRSGDAAGEEVASEAPGPQDDAERAQMRRLLEAHIDALPDGYRSVFVLRAVEELSVEETAAALAIPPATVRSRYFRARGLLRSWMPAELDPARRDAFAFAGARCDRIVRKVLGVLGAALAAVSLTACGEQPPRPAPQGETGYEYGDGAESPLRERTLQQGESARMRY
jgi:RNA polymerase sigma-70 factor, ECF subfamily